MLLSHDRRNGWRLLSPPVTSPPRLETWDAGVAQMVPLLRLFPILYPSVTATFSPPQKAHVGRQSCRYA